MEAIIGFGFLILVLVGWGVYSLLQYYRRSKVEAQYGQMRIVIVDHYSRIIYTNKTNKGTYSWLSHEIDMRGSGGKHYSRQPLTSAMSLTIGDTMAIVDRRENMYWIDIVGDIMP